MAILGILVVEKNQPGKGENGVLYAFWKRLADISGALILLLVLLPLFLLIMLAIAADSSGNVIFIQYRAGIYGKPFKILKFRTMKIGTPANVATRELRNPAHYITPVGRFLRRTSLDELPQLWNILKGDMSFVGPRPVVLTETDLLELRRRHGADSVRPGITGLAQVRGRDHVDDRRKARYDAFYVQHKSARLDIWILIQTVRCVLSGEGIQEGTGATVPDKELKRHKSRPRI